MCAKILCNRTANFDPLTAFREIKETRENQVPDKQRIPRKILWEYKTIEIG